MGPRAVQHVIPNLPEKENDTVSLLSEYMRMNRYSYVLNDPVNLMDPYGLWSIGIANLGPCGIGGGGIFTFGSKDGTFFFDLQAGVGAGAGISCNPDGGPPSQIDVSDKSFDSRSIYIAFAESLNAGIGYGQFGA